MWATDEPLIRDRIAQTMHDADRGTQIRQACRGRRTLGWSSKATPVRWSALRALPKPKVRWLRRAKHGLCVGPDVDLGGIYAWILAPSFAHSRIS
jgi:hypothetical protein